MCPVRSPKRPFDASLQLDTYISFSENIYCAHTPYSLMLLLNDYVGYADYIKKLLPMQLCTNCALKEDSSPNDKYVLSIPRNGGHILLPGDCIDVPIS